MGIVVDNSDYKYGNSGGGPSIIIPNEIIDTDEFQDLYFNNQDITGTVKFPNLTKIGYDGLSSAFYGCIGLTSVEFPNLTEIVMQGLTGTFSGCTGLTSVEFPNLTEIADDGLFRAFRDCTGLTSVEFPNLQFVGNYGLAYAFNNCTGLTSVEFPNLTEISEQGLTNAFMFSNILEIYFRADVKSVIEAQPQYDSKFGAPNATIYFDL